MRRTRPFLPGFYILSLLINYNDFYSKTSFFNESDVKMFKRRKAEDELFCFN
jgi:hypothetical protein